VKWISKEYVMSFIEVFHIVTHLAEVPSKLKLPSIAEVSLPLAKPNIL